MKVKKCGNVCRSKTTETMSVTCPNCKAELEIVPTDVHGDLTRVFPRYYIKCKCCGQWARIKLKEMTKTFKDEVISLNISM